MKDVNRLIALLQGRGKPWKVLIVKFPELDRLIRVARVNGVPDICTGDIAGEVWVFKGHRQREDEQYRQRLREMFDSIPEVRELQPFPESVLRSTFRSVIAGKLDGVMREFGYYCDEDADWEEERTGRWYRFVGFEMPDDVRLMLTREIRYFMQDMGILDKEVVREEIDAMEVFEGLDVGWFDLCWAVAFNTGGRSTYPG